MVIGKKDFDFIKQKQRGSVFEYELGLNQGKFLIRVEADFALVNDEFKLEFREKVKDNFLYLLDEQGLIKIEKFCEFTNKYYKLTPTADWPTVSISSVPMHKLASPKKDTQAKIDLIRPFGCCLDTCMGPGYTAILSSKKAKKVLTFEKDANIYDLAKINPISRQLFNSSNIEIKKEDVYEGINQFKPNTFDCIIHDPPTFTMAPELFSDQFYARLIRVLRPKGRLFHYTPLYKIKKGFDFPGKVEKKLQKAGFKKIKYSKEACGLICYKY